MEYCVRLIFRNVDRRELSLRYRSASRYVGTYCLSVTEGLDRERVALFREHQRTTQNLGTDFHRVKRKKRNENFT